MPLVPPPEAKTGKAKNNTLKLDKAVPRLVFAARRKTESGEFDSRCHAVLDQTLLSPWRGAHAASHECLSGGWPSWS